MILGMSLIGHDPGFAVIKDGRIVDTVELERINGDRFGFGWALSSGKIRDDKPIKKAVENYIAETSFFWSKHSKCIRRVSVAGTYSPKKKVHKLHHRYALHFIACLNKKFNVSISNDILHVKHHLSHAALACFTSPFLSSIVVSIDGQGNDGYFKIYCQSNNHLVEMDSLPLQMGRTYEANALIIGGDFGIPQAVAGKLMGLSAYGNNLPHYYRQARRFITKFSSNKKFRRKFSKKTVKPTFNGVSDKNAQDWMKSFQVAWTDMIIGVLSKYVSADSNLCLTGGCALNGITNYRIYQTCTKNIYIPSNPNDAGLSCGAALYCYYDHEDNPYHPVNYQTPFLGIPILDYHDKDRYMQRKDYVGEVDLNQLSDILRNRKIVGIIGGNSEIGPRALGNRSIICDCTSPEMKDIINEKVKFREWYRPFAPVVRREDTGKYFNFDGDSYYMSYVVTVLSEVKTRIPAVCHVDGSARLQIVTKESHTLLYNLLSLYQEKFGIGVLLNTSFNIRGRAILSKLSDSFDVLDNTQLDGLYIDGHFWESL